VTFSHIVRRLTMKIMRMLVCLLAAAAMTIPSFAEPLTQRERDRALSELNASRKQFLDAIDGLSPEQWNFKPDDSTWSVGEVAEHIALTERLVPGMLPRILETPVTSTKPEGSVDDDTVLKRITNRDQKFKAPEVIQPQHEWKTRAEVVAAYQEARGRTLDYVRTTSDELRGHYMKHPLGNMDAYQWLLLTSGHNDRHTAQILEVKANPKFPK